jgi:hypothetical protein
MQGIIGGLQIRLDSLPSSEDSEDMTCQLQIPEVVSVTLEVEPSAYCCIVLAALGCNSTKGRWVSF